MSQLVRLPGSFRDPAGFVFVRDGVLYRQVNRSFAETYDAVVASGLYDALHGQGLLVAHTEADVAVGTADAYRVLQPERLGSLSHPFEWSPGQLRAAALVTLQVQKVAMAHGMTLRDASAYNVQFRGGRAVFIDTLSFGPLPDGKPWVAYGQFCEQFLAPLALQTLVDPRMSRLLVANVGGVPLDLASKLLPGRTRLRPGLAMHIHAHAKARTTGGEADVDKPARQATFSRQALAGLVEGLISLVSKLTWEPAGTTWVNYYEEAGHYDDDAMAAKVTLVDQAIADLAPATVWDLGANTGRFAQIAASHGANVIAWDIDHGAVERGWRQIAQQPPTTGDVLPLVLDLANPSPAVGWGHTERPSLADRGPVDVVLALALVHHLAIGNNVPLPSVATELARLGRHVLLEWVPPDDPKVKVLKATREDIFTDYTTDGFEAAIADVFDIQRRDPLPGSSRVLYRLRSRMG